jgi:hypothetical protein
MNEPTIAKNSAVEVYQVANGFLVKLPHMMMRGDCQPIEASMVFQSFAALAAWMAQHFSHRDPGVKNDA